MLAMTIWKAVMVTIIFMVETETMNLEVETVMTGYGEKLGMTNYMQVTVTIGISAERV